jgi:hypothetical protein
MCSCREAIPIKLNLHMEQKFHRQFLGNLKMTNVGQNMYCPHTRDVEAILKFKTFKGFMNTSYIEMANN